MRPYIAFLVIFFLNFSCRAIDPEVLNFLSKVVSSYYDEIHKKVSNCWNDPVCKMSFLVPAAKTLEFSLKATAATIDYIGKHVDSDSRARKERALQIKKEEVLACYSKFKHAADHSLSIPEPCCQLFTEFSVMVELDKQKIDDLRKEFQKAISEKS